MRLLSSLRLLATGLLLPVALAGQNLVPPTAPAADTVVVPPAVVLGRDTIAVLRAGLGPFDAADRAAAANQRLDQVASGRLGAADSVWMRLDGENYSILVADRTMFVIAPGDAAEGSTQVLTAQRALRTLSTALAGEARSRGLIGILIGIGLTLLATALFVLVFRLIGAGMRRLRAFVLPQGRQLIPDLTVKGFTLLRASQVMQAVSVVLDVLKWLLITLAAYSYLTFVLSRFYWTKPWADALGGYLLGLITRFGLAIVGVVPDLIVVAGIVLVTRFVVRLADGFFAAVEAGNIHVNWIHPDVAKPTRKLVTLLLWVFALVVMYPYLPGSQTTAFKGISVFIGLVISLGSTGLVGNAMNGLVLMYSRALKVGDYIDVGGTTGTVIDLGMLATKLRTPKGVVVTIPNGVVSGGQVKNFTREAATGRVALHTVVGLGYDVPWRQAEQLLTGAALEVEGILKEPAPFVLQQLLGDFAVNYELNVFTEQPEKQARLYSDLHKRIQDRFNAAGVEIMSPAFYVRRTAPDNTVVPRERWGDAPDRGGAGGAA